MVGFNNKANGQTAFEDIDELQSEKEIVLEDLALVYKNDRGKVKVRQTEDATFGKGLARGGVLGLLAGIVVAAGPAGWGIAALSTVTGGALGGIVAAFDDGIDNSMMRALGRSMETNEATLLVLGTKEQIQALEEGLAPYSAELAYEVVPEASQNLIKEMSKLSLDEIGGSAP